MCNSNEIKFMQYKVNNTQAEKKKRKKNNNIMNQNLTRFMYC